MKKSFNKVSAMIFVRTMNSPMFTVFTFTLIHCTGGMDMSAFDATLGTIGAGNHFAELQVRHELLLVMHWLVLCCFQVTIIVVALKDTAPFNRSIIMLLATTFNPQRVEQVIDHELFHQLGLDETSLYLLVHSGSRGLGSAILDAYIRQHGTSPLVQDSPDAIRYLQMHDNALNWAKRNRALIAKRFLELLGEDPQQCPCVLDVWHNFVAQKEFKEEHDQQQPPEEEPSQQQQQQPPPPPPQQQQQQHEAKNRLWLHRKGAAPADCGPVVIPGSRGSFSYLVMPCNASPLSGYSLAHGAGRKWNRSKALETIKNRYPDASKLEVTELNSYV